MTCRCARRHIAELFDNEACGASNRDLRAHVMSCPDCGPEYEELKVALASIEPPLKMRASADFQERVMSKLNAHLEAIRRAEDSKPGGKRFFAMIPRLALAAAVVVGLMVAFPFLSNLGGRRARSQAMSLLAQSVEAMSGLSTVHIQARMRTLPADDFELIGLDYDFVPVGMWKQFTAPMRWRIEKPGRVVVMDGTSSLLFVSPNQVTSGSSDAGFVEWLKPLLDVDKVLDKELRMAQHQQSKMTLEEQTHNGARVLVLTIKMTAQVDSPDDWLRNKSINGSDHSRIYRFDAGTRRLVGLQVFVHASQTDVLVFEVTGIRYNEPVVPALWSVALPPDVIKSVSPEKMPASLLPLPTTPREAVVRFFDALSREDWDELLTVWPQSAVSDATKARYGGLQVLSIGEPFRSRLYPGWFVPYEIRLKSGELKKHSLAVRNDNPAGRYVFDGGLL
jgi:hypothetical protein